MFICTSLNHHCIALLSMLSKRLNIVLLRHIIGRYRVTINIYMHFIYSKSFYTVLHTVYHCFILQAIRILSSFLTTSVIVPNCIYLLTFGPFCLLDINYRCSYIILYHPPVASNMILNMKHTFKLFGLHLA